MIYAFIAAAILALGFGSGWSVHSWKSDAEHVAEVRALEAARAAQEKRANEIATRFESRLNTIRSTNRTYYNETRHETEKTVYRDCVVPASGKLLLDAAIDAANATPQPDRTVPTAGKTK